jgi:hypothetical protein
MHICISAFLYPTSDSSSNLNFYLENTNHLHGTCENTIPCQLTIPDFLVDSATHDS